MNWYKNVITNNNTHILKEAWNWRDLPNGFSASSIAAIISLAIAINISSQKLKEIVDKSGNNPQTVINTLQHIKQNSSNFNVTEDMLNPDLTHFNVTEDMLRPPPIKSQIKNKSTVEQSTVEQSKNTENNSLTKDQTLFVARVIFAETTGVSPYERELVVGTMNNRINATGFGRGKLDNRFEVVNERNAFSAINDSQSKVWPISAKLIQFMNNPPQSKQDKEIWARYQKDWYDCVNTAKKDNKPVGASGRPIVYYHDKRIKKPKGWDNKIWTAVKEIETKHFIFYSIVPSR